MRGIVSLLILLILVAGLCAFSVFAHNKVESSNNQELRAQVERYEAQQESRVKHLRATQQARMRDRTEVEESLLIAFPNEADQERIRAAFNAAYGEEETEDDQVETDAEKVEVK